MKFKNIFIIVTIAMVLIASGCSNQEQNHSSEEVSMITNEVLVAFNDVDYSVLENHFSQKMLRLMSKDTFLELQAILQETSGDFISIDEPRLAQFEEGSEVFIFTGQFEKEEVQIQAGFKNGFYKVDRLFFDSPNLRLRAEQEPVGEITDIDNNNKTSEIDFSNESSLEDIETINELDLDNITEEIMDPQ